MLQKRASTVSLVSKVSTACAYLPLHHDFQTPPRLYRKKWERLKRSTQSQHWVDNQGPTVGTAR